jgi:hypothetical protein
MGFWGLAGFGLGWWLAVLLPRRVRGPGAPSVDAPEFVWTLWIAAAFAVLLLAFAEYFGWFGSAVYAIEGFLLSRRVSWLTAGFLLGFGISRYRDAVGKCAVQFYFTLLGRGGGKSAWALQAAVGILSLLLIIVALSPDILDHLESIKAGEVEAKFASVSTATREAIFRLTLPLSNELSVKQLIGSKGFLDGSPRDKAVMALDKSSIRSERIHIRDVLFDDYIQPMGTLLVCLEQNELLESETHSNSFVKLALALRNAIVGEMQPKSRLDKKRLRELLLMIDRELIKIDNMIRTQVSTSAEAEKCKFDPKDGMTLAEARSKIHLSARTDNPNIGETNQQGNSSGEEAKGLPPELVQMYRERSKVDAQKKVLESDADGNAVELIRCMDQAAAKLDTSEGERRYTLSFIDPYVVAAAADLLNLGRGPAAKADFLTLVKSKYPIEMKFFQPGLVNLYYQLGDVKNKTETPWPFEERIKDLDQAMQGVEYVIAEFKKTPAATEKMGSQSGTKEGQEGVSDVQTEPPKQAQPTQDLCPPRPRSKTVAAKTAEDFTQIVDLYFTVKFFVLTRFIETYYLRALAGDPLTDVDKLRWMDFYRQLERILNTGRAAVRLDAPDARVPIPTEDRPYWESALSRIKGGNAAQLLDADIGMALSSIMLTEDKSHKASAQACALARRYLAEARGSIGLIDGMDDAQRDHLHGHALQVEQRVGVSC